jgi:hypothetical protein
MLMITSKEKLLIYFGLHPECTSQYSTELSAQLES